MFSFYNQIELTEFMWYSVLMDQGKQAPFKFIKFTELDMTNLLKGVFIFCPLYFFIIEFDL